MFKRRSWLADTAIGSLGVVNGLYGRTLNPNDERCKQKKIAKRRAKNIMKRK